MKISISHDVKFILDCLESFGFEAYIVGGCVRDFVLGIEPNDWDIATSANPCEIKNCFKEYDIIDIGQDHGTIGVIINHNVYEVTTYRIDGEYLDGRHPQNVEFTDNILKDLARRDFTINAIAYNEKRGFVDPYNGILDIQRKALRCVGVPDERFNEDALRILRALRFAAVYDFDIEVNTANSIVKNRMLLNQIAVERISAEFNKLVCGTNVCYILRRYKDVFAVFIPELVSTFNCNQNTPHHNKTVWKHSTSTMSHIKNDLLLRMVMLFHDIGKPMALKTDRNGRDHFHNHQRFSAELAKTALERLRYPTSFINSVIVLIEYHDVRPLDCKADIKRLLNEIGEENFELLLHVQRADVMGQSNYMRECKLSAIDNADEIYKEIISNDECYKLKQLNINGSDLIHLGITKGTQIGYILNVLLEEVIKENIDNERNVLIKKALSVYDNINV